MSLPFNGKLTARMPAGNQIVARDPPCIQVGIAYTLTITEPHNVLAPARQLAHDTGFFAYYSPNLGRALWDRLL